MAVIGTSASPSGRPAREDIEDGYRQRGLAVPAGLFEPLEVAELQHRMPPDDAEGDGHSLPPLNAEGAFSFEDPTAVAGLGFMAKVTPQFSGHPTDHCGIALRLRQPTPQPIWRSGPVTPWLCWMRDCVIEATSCTLKLHRLNLRTA